MTYGFRVWAPNGKVTVDPLYLGVSCAGMYTIPRGESQTLHFPNIPFGQLRMLYIGAMGHDTSFINVSGYAAVTFTPRYQGQLNVNVPSETRVAAFARTTIEPDYGFMAISDSGERLVSTIYPVPEFVGKVTFGPAPTQVVSIGNGNLLHFYNYTVPGFGSGRDRIVLYSLPSLDGNFWFKGSTNVLAAGTGNYTLTLQLVASTAIPVPLPEAYIFALNNHAQSGDSYGLRVWDGVGRLLFDSGKYHMAARDSMSGIVFPAANSSGQNDYFSTGLSQLAKPLVLLPPYVFQSYTPIQNQQSSTYRRSEGFVRRVGGILSTRMFQVQQSTEDSASNASYQFGNNSDNATFIVDGSLYD